MPKIQSVSVCVARVPLDVVTSFATRTVSARDYCLVKARSSDGVEGIGFCYVGSAGGRIAQAAVEELLAKKLIGQESTRTEGLWHEMYQESLLQGRSGSVMRAISILDIALWDLNARAAKLPLHNYLGAHVAERVPAYASGGYYLAGKTPKKLGEEMASYVKAGFKAVKMKVGRLSPKEEETRVRAAREAVGPDIALMLDANNAWNDVPTALQYVRRWEKYDPYWIEEPFGPDDIDGHAKLARLTPVVVATGEIAYGRWYHKELLDKGGAEILQTDACVCGGVSEWKRIAAMASGYGVTVCPHWFHDVHAPLVAATPNARYVEFFPDDQVLNFRRLIDRQLQHKNGNLLLHRSPGLGFRFDEKAVKQYALTPAKPWSVCK
ncbi:MAG: mandelate racemase/muconate lactonizing enzyme family protein [Betaproteobacteria bacterium]|nr:mandelate racemase/muconate lactonizing enzyme family protein [Betaproteobacteria bacterium]